MLPVLVAALACAGQAFAQNVASPGPSENARLEYAQVLRAEPVYQTLRATSMVERCEATTPVTAEEQRRGFARVVGAVRDVLRSEDGKVEEVDRSAGGDCRMVPVEREFRRPIAYDVDYVHNGVKYRSRLPYDPGQPSANPCFGHPDRAAGGRALSRVVAAVAVQRHACEDARLMHACRADADILTSARMASGMTSRARRPEAHILRG